MTPALRASARHWLIGLGLAASGVMINRLLAPSISSTHIRAAFALVGECIALTGLFVIMLGIRRRLRDAEKTAASTSSV